MSDIIFGQPAFGYLKYELKPGESLFAEADSMIAMSSGIDIKPRLKGGLFSALFRWIFGRESLVINEIQNYSNENKVIYLSQGLPGEIREVELKSSQAGIALQPGAYLCSSPKVKLSVQWAGFASFLGREGLFKLRLVGEGKAYYGAYGALSVKEVKGSLKVDSGHLVAYQPHLKLKASLAGGFFTSFLSGEGLVTEVVGDGAIVTQSRSLTGIRDWLNPHLPRR